MRTLLTRAVKGLFALSWLILLLAACYSIDTTAGSLQTTHVIQPGTTLFTFRSPAPNTDMYAVAWSPDGKRIAYGGSDTLVYVWDQTAHALAFTARGHAADIWNLAWSPDGKRLASASWDHTVQVWNATTGHPILIYRGHKDIVLTLAWSPDGTQIASASVDVRVWQAS